MSWEKTSTPSSDSIPMRNPSVTWNDVQGQWHTYKGKVRQKWGLITNEDVDLIGGHYEELSGKIQRTYNVSKEEADRQIEEWLAGHEDSGSVHDAANPTSPI